MSTKRTKIIDITKNLADVFISLSSFGSDAVFELVHRDKIKNIFIKGIVDLDNINPDEFWLPHIDIDAILDAISEEDVACDRLYLARIKRTDGIAFCEYINEISEALGEELTAYVNVLWSERSELSIKACAAADMFNKAISAWLKAYQHFGLKAGTGSISTDNSEIVDAIKNACESLGNNICNKLDSFKGRFEAAKQEALNKELQAHNMAVAEVSKNAVNSELNWGSEMVDSVESMVRKGKHIWLYGPSRSGKSKAVSIALGRLNTEFVYLNLNEYLSARELVSRAFTYGGDVGYKDTVLKVKLDELESGRLDRLAVIIEDPNSIKFNELMNSFKSFLGGSDTLTIGDYIYKNLKGKLIFIVTSNDRGNGKFVMDSAFGLRFTQIKSYKYLDKVYEYRKKNDISQYECTPQCKEQLANLIHDTEEIIQQINNRIENDDIGMSVDLISKLMITTCLEESIKNGDTFDDFKLSIETTVWSAVDNSISMLRRNGISQELKYLIENLNTLEKKWSNQWILKVCQ